MPSPLSGARRPVEGVAEHLPFDDAAFDAAMATVTVHQWPDPSRGLAELRAAGETSRGRTPDARDRLTPQELQIAQMAAEGLTKEEAQELLDWLERRGTPARQVTWVEGKGFAIRYPPPGG